MINWNEQITQEQARYILEEVFPKAGYRIDAKTLAWWRDAHNYAFKEQVGIPGCSCEYIQTFNVWNSRLSQYRSQIEAVAYPPKPTTTGKPKTSAKSSKTPSSPSGLTE